MCVRMTRNAPSNSLLDDLSVSFRVHFSTCNERTDILVDQVGCLQVMAIGLRLSIFQSVSCGLLWLVLYAQTMAAPHTRRLNESGEQEIFGALHRQLPRELVFCESWKRICAQCCDVSTILSHQVERHNVTNQSKEEQHIVFFPNFPRNGQCR